MNNPVPWRDFISLAIDFAALLIVGQWVLRHLRRAVQTPEMTAHRRRSGALRRASSPRSLP